jgi:hypothetical protein
MHTVEARYEWRVWGKRLDEIDATVRSLSACLGTQHSTETYLVSTATIAVNPKVRADRLDVKVLVATCDGYEQWQPRLKAAFPVTADLLATELFPLLGLEAPHLGRKAYSESQLIETVIDPHQGWTAVRVEKHRRAYEIFGCIAEVADVTIAGQSLQTAAVESLDLDAVRAAGRRAGLEARSNISYPRMILETLELSEG